jgi:hypothetical protein
MYDVEQLKKSWERFCQLTKKIDDPCIDKMIETLSERMLMCPNASRDADPGCYPGGLVQVCLETALHMRQLEGSFGDELDPRAVLKVALLHDLGKIGSLQDNYFVEQESDWHKEKLGQYYKFNEKIQKMSPSHRTLCLLQHFGVKLNEEEWLAIQLSNGSYFEENRFYVGSEPTLALVLQTARRLVYHNHAKRNTQ